jgi:geranylgeranyl diphosphate synthase type II
MHSFKDLTNKFAQYFDTSHFPHFPSSLYTPSNYFLNIGGKRIRPVMCLMGNELFDEIKEDAYHAAVALELFHNFTLIHDDIMDAAPLRRGFETVHQKFGTNTAILSGDVMLIRCYDYLNKIDTHFLPKVLHIFNKTAREVCEGQQLDMDFESRDDVSLEEYIHMIALKTSVLIAASLQIGAVLGGASEGNYNHIYEFGKNLGIAFQIQDDYLDAFGNPEKFGKDVGGDIKQNKKTFLLLHALEVANEQQKNEMQALMQQNPANKVERMLQIYRECNVNDWAKQLKENYLQIALEHLENIAVVSSRKKSLLELAHFLIQRDY